MSDAAELEREAEAARARLSDTADEIRARMSPGQMMDEVLNQFRGGDGSQMLANLRDQARDNPMALALVGSGLAWLMMGSGPQASSRTATAPYPETSETFRSYRQEGAPGLGSSTRDEDGRALASREAGEPGAGSTPGMGERVSDAFSSARSAMGDGLHEAGDRAQRLAHDLRSAGGDALGGVRHSATGVGHQARDTFFDVLEREPLVIGAIGVAVGAAIGAFLPATEVERQHLGSAGEALKEKADALVDRGMAKAQEAAAEVYETARDEADRQGLLPGDKPLAGKVEEVVRAVGKTVGGIAEKNAPGTSSSGASSGASSGGASGTSPVKGATGTGSAETATGTATGPGAGTISDTGSGVDSGLISDTGPGRDSDTGRNSGPSQPPGRS